MSIVDEIWKDIPDYEGYYQVSNLGRVRSVDRRVSHPRSGFITLKGCILKPAISRLYYGVNLSVNSVTRSVPVHTLVARAFLGANPDRLTINHIDGNKLNNRADNLEYCTHLQNVAHAIASGLWDSRKGQKHGMAKLCDSDISVIRQRLSLGESQSSIAKDYGVCQQTIQRINARKIWSHIN